MNAHQIPHQFWQTHVQRHREQGVTLGAYAAQEGLTLSVLYSWNRRFKREASTTSSFSRVAVAPVPADSRLGFRNGLVLKWSGEVDTEHLVRLVSSLK